MGLGTGVGMIAVGAVLVWAMDLDLPYVDVDALGAVLLVAGVVVVVSAAVMRAQRPGTSPAGGLVLVTVGASLLWAVDVDIPFVYDAALGVILLLGGAVTVVASVALDRPRTLRRVVVHRP